MTLGVRDTDCMPAKNTETTLRADAETARMIRAAASLRGLSIAEYLREVMLPIARKDVSDGLNPSKPRGKS